MTLLKHIAAVIVGFVVFFLVYGISYTVIELLGSLPIIGYLLYYPSGASWALTVLPVTTAVPAACWLAEKISKTTKPMAVILAVFWIFNIISMFVFHLFTWGDLIESVFGIITSCVMFEAKN